MRKRKSSASSARKPAKPADSGRGQPTHAAEACLWIYGIHAVSAALANPDRHCLRLVATRDLGVEKEALSAPLGARLDLPRDESLDKADLERLLPAGAVHQGVALLVRPLPHRVLSEVLAEAPPSADRPKRRLIVALDQVTDPHNVGAILRSAAAFGATALLLPDRHSAPESGVLAKVASGALDSLPIVRVTNLARSLKELKSLGFWCLGLDEASATDLAAYQPGSNLVLILGAEGKGLRRLTREHCDLLLRLPTRPPIGSLNVSNAAAVALYALMTG